MISRIPGTLDAIDCTLKQELVTRIRAILHTACFTEVQTPIIEHCELFQRSLGEHTDVIGKEMYLVTTAHETEQPSLCLRPEGTAPIMRAYLNNGIAAKPWRAFMVGPFFRHERPQKGRYRQFEQVSVEIINAQSTLYDAQLIALFDRLFHETFQLRDYALQINYMGCAEDRTRFRATLLPFLQEHAESICGTCRTRMNSNPLRVFDCKSQVCKEIYRTAPTITHSLCEPCTGEWTELGNVLAQLGVSFMHAPQLVRGLDYYSKTVFEFTSMHLGAQSTFCAGGRYDSLAKEIGAATDAPSVGGAIGIERLLMLLDGSDVLIKHDPAPVAIIPVTAAERIHALTLAHTLHAHGITADVALEAQALKKQFRWADSLQAHYACIIGSDEIAQNSVKLKDMRSGAEETIASSLLINKLKS